MFSTLGLYRQIPCPVEDECTALNCIFWHREDVSQRVWRNVSTSDVDIEPPTKRQKLEVEGRPSLPHSDAAPRAEQTPPAAFVGVLSKPSSRAEIIKDASESQKTAKNGQKSTSTTRPTQTQARPISPPPLRAQPQPSTPTETLNPRLIQHDPAGHQTRWIYLRKLHEVMARINQEARSSSETSVKASALTDSQLITAALDEEEQFAKDNPTVYANVIKMRMVAYKKMTVEQWRDEQERRKRMTLLSGVQSGKSGTTAQNDTIPLLESGLTADQDIQIVLRHFLASTDQLDQLPEYVKTPPTNTEIEQAIAGVTASQGWEQCERCKARFQVFPDRREADGALTGGGTCIHHWGRINRGKRGANVNGSGPTERTYSCCEESVGASVGCTSAATHVFKASDANRLAAVLPFQRTPSNRNHVPAIALDCEMGYTVYGMELIRVTATQWPQGDTLLDVLVRPIGAVLDLNSRWSGVWPDDMAEALPYANGENDADNVRTDKSPRIVSSPAVARDLLFRLISPETIIIGHALENDLNALRIIHPRLADTALLFPHPRGLPIRMALRTLVRRELGREIQVEHEGENGLNRPAGHDSKEDAIAAGDLVRLRVAKEWRRLKAAGWTVVNGRVTEP